MSLTHVFFDIGGVLGTNGWDREQRARALQKFGVEDEDFEHRHHQVVSEFETGAMSLEEYLDVTVFYTPRLFSREDFELYMLSLSEPNPYRTSERRRSASGSKNVAGASTPIARTTLRSLSEAWTGAYPAL